VGSTKSGPLYILKPTPKLGISGLLVENVEIKIPGKIKKKGIGGE